MVLKYKINSKLLNKTRVKYIIMQLYILYIFIKYSKEQCLTGISSTSPLSSQRTYSQTDNTKFKFPL